MRIADLSTVVVGNPWKNRVLVRLTTDTGVVGWGQATGRLQTMPVLNAIEEMRPLYLGADPRQVHDLWQRMHRGLFLHANAAMAGMRADARIRAYGLEVNEHEAARHPCADTNSLRLFEPGWERRGRPAPGKEVDGG